MQINYLDAVSSVLKLMKQQDSRCKGIDMHMTCYTSLFKHLLEGGIPFSMEAALDWLEIKKREISHASCSNYRNALFRLEHYLLFGNINSPFCRTDSFFFCRSGMSESFYRLTYELEENLSIEQNPCYYQMYSVAIKEFFRLATSSGIVEPEAITIDIIIEYWDKYCISLGSLSRRQNAVCAISALMKYLNKRGHVPSCYREVLPKGNVDKLKKMKLPHGGNMFHPSTVLETKAEEYIDALSEWKYKESSKAIYRTDFLWYFLFLELNHMEHSSDAVKAWVSVLPDYPNQKRADCSVKAHRIRTISMFDVFIQNGTVDNFSRNYPTRADTLPEWSRSILDGFIENRRQDGMTEKTLIMCRSAGSNFFLYLAEKGIRDPADITPEVVKEFHYQDHHSTPESKNAYSIKLRQLLSYMADMEIVPPALIFAVSTTFAPSRHIVDVLSDETVEKIYEYRESAASPIELRDVAIVMLGLRMGIRGCDILKLRINDFDWQSQTVSFVQQKTRKSITLPVPTDVGNSVYKYICHGRPESADSGNGFIFIHHQAPYVPLKATIACRGALKRILSACGIELAAGQGFHMTRKTFATRMLRANNRLDDISNALGHARQETAEVYLERDEEGMRLCPLDFGGVL